MNELIPKAMEVLKREKEVSTKLFEVELNIGFPKARQLVDALEYRGLIGPAFGSAKKRKVLK